MQNGGDDQDQYGAWPCPYRQYVGDLGSADPPFEPGDPKTIEGYFVELIQADLGGGFGLDTGTYIIRLTG